MTERRFEWSTDRYWVLGNDGVVRDERGIPVVGITRRQRFRTWLRYRWRRSAILHPRP